MEYDCRPHQGGQDSLRRRLQLHAGSTQARASYPSGSVPATSLQYADARYRGGTAGLLHRKRYRRDSLQPNAVRFAYGEVHTRVHRRLACERTGARSTNAAFREPDLTANLALVDKLRPIAARYGRPLGQLAIAWTLRRPDITAVIVGARRPSQIEESAPAGDWVLPDDVLAEIDQLLAENEEAKRMLDKVKDRSSRYGSFGYNAFIPWAA